MPSTPLDSSACIPHTTDTCGVVAGCDELEHAQELLLTDWLPRKAVLDAAQRAALPDVLRRWVAYALGRRGVDARWITPVVDAVDAHLPAFRQAFDDGTSWGPAKQIAAALTDRGIDLTDRQAVDDAIHALNAERLARRLLP